MEISTRVKREVSSQPLLEYMSGRFTYRSVEEWGALIDAGAVRVNGEPATQSTPVSTNDLLTTNLPDPDPPTADYRYTLVYEDEWLLGVNKPPNLRVHGRGRFIHANLIHHLRHVRTPGYPKADLVNRLDANTSGLVLIAKKKEMMAHLQALFRERKIEKRYLAIVSGHPQQLEGKIEMPIGRLPALEGVYRYGNGPNVEKLKPAETRFEVVTRYLLDEIDPYSLVRLWPKTGRTHQLRVHLASLGHPIVGDMLYRLNDADFLAYCEAPHRFQAPLLGRQALHCEAYTFFHPFLAKEMTVEAPLAADIVGLIAQMAVTIES